MTRKQRTPPPAARERSPSELDREVRAAMAWMKARSSKRYRDNLPRFGISAHEPLGLSMPKLRILARRLGRDHELAAALWDTECHEARVLATLIDEPARVTPAQMDRWCRDFDNWGICDAACFALFDRTPHAWGRVSAWRNRRGEFQRRAAFALLASLALHDKSSEDRAFARCLPFVEEAASDGRNFVKKGVSWALRAIGKRSQGLHAAAVGLARRLAGSGESAPRWIGKDALRELTSPAVVRRLAARRRASG